MISLIVFAGLGGTVIILFLEGCEEEVGIVFGIMSIIVILWIGTASFYVEEDHKMYDLSGVEITDVQPLTDRYIVGDTVLYLEDGEVYSHDIDNEEYKPLHRWHKVHRIENIKGTIHYEVVQFNVPRGTFLRWWKYTDRWVVRITKR